MNYAFGVFLLHVMMTWIEIWLKFLVSLFFVDARKQVLLFKEMATCVSGFTSVVVLSEDVWDRITLEGQKRPLLVLNTEKIFYSGLTKSSYKIFYWIYTCSRWVFLCICIYIIIWLFRFLLEFQFSEIFLLENSFPRFTYKQGEKREGKGGAYYLHLLY